MKKFHKLITEADISFVQPSFSIVYII